MTGYWDIHNHILPGVDDGSGCMRETMEMLEEEYRQGVRHIVFTPLEFFRKLDTMHMETRIPMMLLWRKK